MVSKIKYMDVFPGRCEKIKTIKFFNIEDNKKYGAIRFALSRTPVDVKIIKGSGC